MKTYINKALFRLYRIFILYMLYILMLFGITTTTYATGNFDTALGTVFDAQTQQHFENTVVEGSMEGENIKELIFKLTLDYAVPLFMTVAIIIAIFGFYKMMLSDKQEDTDKGIDIISYGIIGIILIQSAKRLTYTLVGTSSTDPNGIISQISNSASFNQIATLVYDKIMFPFLELGMYLVMGVLFIILLVNAIKYISNSEKEDASKSAKNILTSSILGILIIISAKQIVQAVYGQQDQITKGVINNFGDIGDPILANVSENRQRMFNIINWIMSFLAFALLGFILYDTYILIFTPTDESKFKKLRTNILYMFIGLAIMGLCYTVVSFIIPN